jgi:hypothetical protein
VRSFGAGSVRGRAGVLENGERLLLWAEADVCELPSDGDLIVPLMRELLERSAVCAPAHFAIRGELVVLAFARDLAEGVPDAGALIRQLMAQADGLDEALLERYGGTTRTRTPLPPEGLAPEPEPAADPAGAARDIAAQSAGDPAPQGSLFSMFGKPRRDDA